MARCFNPISRNFGMQMKKNEYPAQDNNGNWERFQDKLHKAAANPGQPHLD